MLRVREGTVVAEGLECNTIVELSLNELRVWQRLSLHKYKILEFGRVCL